MPDIEVELIKDNFSKPFVKIVKGKKIEAIRLNPPENFCNVLANSFKIKSFQVNQYDDSQNLVLLKIEANLSNIEDFHLPFSSNEQIEKIDENFPTSSISYVATIPSYIKIFEFYFFDLNKNRFQKFSKELKIRDESVSTQTDINPNKNEHEKIKVLIFIFFATIFLIAAIFKKSFFYLLIASIFGGYSFYLTTPLKTVCIKENSKIRLLPTKNSTIFQIIDFNLKTKRLNHVNGYTKIELSDGKIGWVKDEDLCKD